MFGTKHEVAKILSLGNPDSVKHYHKRWIDGIHFYKCPGGRQSGYRYNIPLIEHWLQCYQDLNNSDHVCAMAAYQKSLNPKKKLITH